MGFGSGKAIPYEIGPLHMIEEFLEKNKEKDVDFIVEPFLVEPVTSQDGKKWSSWLIKVHAFNEVLSSEVLTYLYEFNGTEGKLFDIIEEITPGFQTDLPDGFPITEINAAVSKFLPFHMVSLDFVKNGGDGQWYCIDINHSCSSWGEVQEKGGSMEHTIYDHMLNILDETAPDNIENKLKDLDEFILAQL